MLGQLIAQEREHNQSVQNGSIPSSYSSRAPSGDLPPSSFQGPRSSPPRLRSWRQDLSAQKMNYDIKLFTGNAHISLAQEIADNLGIQLADMDVSKFSDGEVFARINDNVRGSDVFILQPTCTPVNDNLMELLIIIDAMKRASAKRITAVLPYYGYARQDRKSQPRVPISAKLVADLLTVAGASRVVTLELHAGQIQGFFNVPVDHLYAGPVMIEYLQKKNLRDPVVVSPDAGGMERARAIAKRLNAGIAIIDKRREGPNVAHFMHLVGDVRGKDCIIIDDMIDTGGTLCEAVGALTREGANRIMACGIHAVLSGPAVKRIADSALEEVIVTNTIPLSEEKLKCGKIVVLSVAKTLAEAIRRIHNEESVSNLFDYMTTK